MHPTQVLKCGLSGNRTRGTRNGLFTEVASLHNFCFSLKSRFITFQSDRYRGFSSIVERALGTDSFLLPSRVFGIGLHRSDFADLSSDLASFI